MDLLEQEIVSGSGISWAIFCITPQRDNHASIPPLSFLQAGCPSCRRTNSVKALKDIILVDGVQRAEPHHPAKFRQNPSIRCGVIAIFQFLKMAALTKPVAVNILLPLPRSQ